MAKFKITPTTTVAELKEQFRNEVGCVLRVYQGRSEAPDGATLVSLGAKEGELECRTSRTVGKFEEAFQNELNLKVKVYTKDNWVKVLDGITLAVAGQLPNGMTKAKMEEHLSYKRDEADNAEVVNEETSENEYVKNYFRGIPIIDITLGEVNATKDSENLLEYANENFSIPAIGVVDYGDEWDSKAWVFVTDDPDEAMYPAFDFIEEKQKDGFNGEIFHFQSTACKVYGFDTDVFSLEGTIGCVLNKELQTGKPAYYFEWDSDVDKILFRIRYANGWWSRIFLATPSGKNENLGNIGDEAFETIIHNLEHPESEETILLKGDESRGDQDEPIRCVKLGEKYGFINPLGQIIIPLVYDCAYTFKDGYARVEKDGKYGFIDENGNISIDIKYDYANDFSNGRAKVELNGQKFEIDKNGNRVK